MDVPQITTLGSLLDALVHRGESEGDRKAFDEAVWRQRGVEAAILVTDLSGFTRLTKKHGIIHFLDVFRRCKEACDPIIETWSGTLMKQEADDLIAIFDQPTDAISAAIDMLVRTAKINESLAEDERLHMCIGVESGKVLRFDDDAFGDAVNVAFKLGEDIADKGEILLGTNAFDLAQDANFDFSRCTISEKRTVEAGNVGLEHYSIRLK